MVELASHPNVLLGDLDISKMINGECSAAISGSWDANALEWAFGDNLGVAVLPKFTVDGQEYQMKALAASKCVGVNPNSGRVDSSKQKLCTEFAAFLASEESQLARYEMRGVIPAHKNLRYNEKIMADPAAVAEMDTIRFASVVQPGIPEMNDFWSPMGSFCYNLVDGIITMDNCELCVDEMMMSMNP